MKLSDIPIATVCLIKEFIKPSSEKILVYGDIMLDRYIECGINPSQAEGVPIYKVNETLSFPGGAANVASNLSLLGNQVILFGAIGKDLEGEILLNLLKHTMDIKYILHNQTGKTTVKYRVMLEEEQAFRIDREVAIETGCIQKKKFLNWAGELLSEVKCLVLSDYLKGFLDDESTMFLIEIARMNGIPIVADPKGTDIEKYRGVTVLTPNLNEFNLLTNNKYQSIFDAIEAAKNLRKDLNIDALVLKGDSEGSMLIHDDVIHHKAIKANGDVFVIGAGDSMVATLASAICKGMKISDAFILSNISASLAVSNPYTYSLSKKDFIHILEN
ncbi:bifunctional heptose 7-phosphate kinase/heptose 1-phosphate adenyltransferase [Cytobacillus oceanisediminis]|uniref:bifunctional heptose 7-phosphate kinase/heptose 1-phosphate adenyltransferase n=1 Tax=Cytobacillus oceanisediminis TaxID=665099 RepID=UPI001C22454C|nr:PfkB family carbohydrate kinase [Cytobacillus oceanisediminis]MBU8772090.1 bifunctional hydroxymethylpyrimidine kinase/phosphomethylpyrimidine kinase [Cytobacillus oceanisediminis]